MPADPRSIALRWFKEIWNDKLEGTIEALMAPDATGHMEGGDVKGHGAFKEARAALLSAFPDMHVTVDETVAEGDNVVVRWTCKGNHLGDGLGIAASKSPVNFRGMTWLKIRDGRIVEGWDSWNQGALLESLRVAAQAAPNA